MPIFSSGPQIRPAPHFLVPKPGLDEAGRRKWRLIIDLRPLNLFWRDFKTRYETLSKLGSLISKGEECLFLSFDLADAYHALRIDPEYQQYFGFVLRGRHYNMTALPFGWNRSPYCFTTAMNQSAWYDWKRSPKRRYRQQRLVYIGLCV